MAKDARRSVALCSPIDHSVNRVVTIVDYYFDLAVVRTKLLVEFQGDVEEALLVVRLLQHNLHHALGRRRRKRRDDIGPCEVLAFEQKRFTGHAR